MRLLAVILLSSLALVHAREEGEEATELTFPPDATGPKEPVEGVDDEGTVVGDDGTTAGDARTREPIEEPIYEPEPFLKSGHAREVGLAQVNGLCLTSTNLAPQATASGSGGGSGALGPHNMNDEAPYCTFYWPMSYWGGTIQYVWTTAVSIDHFVIASDAFCAGTVAPPTGPCALESGRSVGSGDVELWDSATSSWVPYGSFSNVQDNHVVYQFASCVTTTALRVVNLHTPTCNTQINPKIYEWSVCECSQQVVAPLDDLCLSLDNVAPNAVATSSGGGVGVFGVQNMNDESPFCMFHWPWSMAAFGGVGATIEYTWSAAQSIQKFVVATDAYCGVQAGCQQAQGRGISQGSVEYLDGNGQWVAAGSFANNQGERIEFDFLPCVSTTGLRLTDIMTHSCNGGFVGHPVVYEWAVCEC